MYLRKSKNLPDAWWGRYVETMETTNGPVRKHRNVRLGESPLYNKHLARRTLREYVDEATTSSPSQ